MTSQSVSHGELTFRKINHKTPIKKVWDMIRKISGKAKSPSYTHLNKVGTDSKATSKTDIAETLGETFCHYSSSFKYSESFLKIKKEQKKVKMNFKSVEADEPSLYSRREKLSLQYDIRLAANPSNPAHEVTIPPNYVDLYEQKPKAIKSFGIRISPLLDSANIKPQNIEQHFTPNIPAWCVKQPQILFDLHSGENLSQIHMY